ncbi:LysM peptidoglycan-binding domain-containing protein [Leifsonia sp. NPDC058230]|uniref:LysM peptidoglycan-binding domain-containing protein n=1 Tax=Leifsonia sp. NPDC058230 TaxID=3346391 RepID=UPI0036DE9314
MSTATVTMSPFTPSATAAAGSAGATRLRLTRRGRVVLTSLAAIPLVVGALFFALNGGGAVATGDQVNVQFHYVTVESGQSLWSIAETVAPSADPRDVIADIVSLNQLESAVVSPGQRIAIPSQYER